MLLFIEIETIDTSGDLLSTGILPRLISIAWLISDQEGNHVNEKQYLIRPEGYSIPSDYSKTHNITTAFALATGNDLKRVLGELVSVWDKIDTVIAFNLKFVERIIKAELLNKNIENKSFPKKGISLMHDTVNYCAIPGPTGYKLPTLNDLYKTIFGQELAEPHNTLTNLRALTKCYLELNRKAFFKATPTTSIHAEPRVALNTIESNPKSENHTEEQKKYSIQFNYAGFGLRLVAWFIDYVLIFIFLSILWSILNLPIPSNAKGPIAGSWYIFSHPFGWIIGWLYFASLESSSKQATLGKLVVGIKVTDLSVRKITFGTASGRFWGKFISGILLGVGYIMAAFTEKKQALHDKMAGCLVIKA